LWKAELIVHRARLQLCLIIALLAAIACDEKNAIKVRKLSFKGVKGVDTSQLQKALATQPSSRLPWGKKNYFDRGRFDTDLMRIKTFYADRGYPDARITSFDVKLNDKQDAVDVVVNIAEGEPIRVGAVHFNGFAALPADHLRALEQGTPLKRGQPRDRQQVVAVQEQALNELRDHGFPYARVSIDERLGGADGKEADITFNGEAGKVAHFGEISVAGNRSVSEHVIDREVSYQPGDLYRRSLIQETQRRLYRMELFQFVSVTPTETDQQPDVVPTRVTVAEGNHQRTTFSAGYGSEEKARVDAEYRQLNFLGGARTASIHGRWSALDRGLQLELTQPYFFAPHLSFGGSAQDWYTYTPAYRSHVTGGRIALTHRATAATSWSVFLSAERDSSAIATDVLGDPELRNNLIALGLDPSTESQQGTATAIGFEFQHSTADNVLDAHHGYQVTFHAEQAGRFLPGTFSYSMVVADGRHYLPLGSRLVWANRAQFGNIDPTNGDQTLVPFSKKFFLGGATSIRGWGRYEVSPLSDSGLPVGGDSMFEFTSELRAPLAGNLGGVLFLDGGDVWANSWGIRFSDLEYAIGPGLRYQTPIGPVRFDLGFQLRPIPGLSVNGEPETRHWRIHFSVGQAF
jgi:outer membrane protein assembly complex protein YaeT